MTVEECRQYLPSLAHLPDSEIEKIRDSLMEIAYFCLDIAKKEWAEKAKK